MVGSGNDIDRLLDDMEPRLLEFIRTRVNSFLKWDLVRFFHENPHTADTAENIALYTGRDAHAVETELLSLAAVDVLQASTVSGMTVYMLATDEDIRDLINRFLLACEDRQFRIKAMYQVIRSMNQSG